MEKKTIEKNLSLYNEWRSVPEEAKKAFDTGRFKGTDVNPMWIIKTLTSMFGPAGIGWFTEVKERYTEQNNDGSVAAFVDINLYFLDKHTGAWSDPIPGTGGSMFCAKERSGMNCSDECYKMALTDALSVAAKALGVGADIYWQADATKYTADTTPAAPPPAAPLVCRKCGRPLQGVIQNGKKYTAEEAQKALDGLCVACWKERKKAQNEDATA